MNKKNNNPIPFSSLNMNNIITEVNLYGFSKFQLFDEDNTTLKELQKIHKLGAETQLPGRIDDYEGGFAKFYSGQEIYNSMFNGNNYFLDWLNLDLIQFLVNKLSIKRKYKLDHLIQTLDTPYSKHIAQDPHFDRIPTLKFMLYLNDMKKENGAFVLSPGSHYWVREKFYKRGRFNDEAFFKETRNIPKPIIENLISLEGKAGTLIIFHTDCIHMQGLVKENESRIFRAGYRFSSRNFIKTFGKKIKSKVLG